MTFTRRTVVRTLLPGLLCTLAWGAEPTLDFIHLTDTHVNNMKGLDALFSEPLAVKAEANARLPRVLNKLNAGLAPRFFLITGDLVDGYNYEATPGKMVGGQIETFRSILDGCPKNIHPLLGNHDIRSARRGDKKRIMSQSMAEEARREWKRQIPGFSKGTYYAVQHKVGKTNYRLLVLDNSDNTSSSAAYVEKQNRWLKEQIAAHPRDRIVIAMHIPLGGAPYRAQIEAAIGTAPNVMLLIGGHNHRNVMGAFEVNGRKIPEVRTAALYAGDENWRKFRLCEDRIEIFAPGSATEVATTIPFQKAAAAK